MHLPLSCFQTVETCRLEFQIFKSVKNKGLGLSSRARLKNQGNIGRKTFSSSWGMGPFKPAPEDDETKTYVIPNVVKEQMWNSESNAFS